MNLDRAGSVELASALAAAAGEFGDVEVGVCPPSVYLDAVIGAVGDSRMGVGAQNM